MVWNCSGIVLEMDCLELFMILSGNLTLETVLKLSGNSLPGTIHDFIWKLHLTSSGNIHDIAWKSVIWKHSWYCLEMSILCCLETFRIQSMIITCLVLIWKPSQAGSSNQFLECFQTNILANPSSGGIRIPHLSRALMHEISWV